MPDRFSVDDPLIAVALRLLAPWRAVTNPIAFGLERVPTTGPVLLVGNHTLYGILDTPILFLLLYERHRIFPRSLGDHLHFMIPGWRALLGRFGAVDGTIENARALLERGETVLVFPGGGREVAKRRGERYTLVWRRRSGFARLALDVGVPIVPFAAVGAEDMLDVVIDADDLVSSPLGALLRRIPRRDALLPVVRGIGPSPVPRPARLYFRFGEPVDARGFRGPDPTRAAWQLREEIRRRVARELAHLLLVQARDPDRFGRPALLGRLLASRRLRRAALPDDG